MALIRFKRGTRAALETAAAANGLVDGEPYFVDGRHLAVGTGVNTFAEISAAVRRVVTRAGATYTLVAADLGALLILSEATPDLTVPDDVDVAWPIGGTVDVIGTTGPVTVIEDTSVTVNVPAGQTLVTEDAGSAFTLVKVAANTWHCIGRMAAV